MYKNKYLKYKQKYLLLKKQHAGSGYKEDGDYFNELGNLVDEIMNNKLINESKLEFIKYDNFDITEDKYNFQYGLEFGPKIMQHRSTCERIMKVKKLSGMFGWLIATGKLINIDLRTVKIVIDGIPSDNSPNILSYLNKYLINDNSRKFVSEHILKDTAEKTYKDFFDYEYTPLETCDELQLLNTTDANIHKKCSFLNLFNVGGACSVPSFWDENNFMDFNESLTRQWMTLLEKIKNDYFPHIEKLIIIIGATYNDTTMDSLRSRNFIDDSIKKKLILLINPCFIVKTDEHAKREEEAFSNYKTYSDIIRELEEKKSLCRNTEYEIKFYWKTYFPLSHMYVNSRIILNKLIEMKVKTTLINRMCDTCFRSMFYLQQKKIQYILNPEQSLDTNIGHRDMRGCFTNIKDVEFPEPVSTDKQLEPII